MSEVPLGKITAKVSVSEIRTTTYSENVIAAPVCSSGPEDPNKSFSEATPSGKIELSITNKKAHGFFRAGREYLVTFEDVTAPAVEKK
jgi:hypothetical protein